MKHFNLVMLGEENSGKSTLLKTLCDDGTFDTEYFSKFKKYYNWDVYEPENENLENEEGKFPQSTIFIC